MKIAFNRVTQTAKKIGRDLYAVIDNTTGKAVAFGTAAMISAGQALALPPDFTSLTSAIDLSTVSAAALLALAALMGLYLIISGGKTIVGFFKGGR
ncbi:hypothetical protein [Thiobacillus sp.]|uniref:hypothetical protein n=1 Tax=Thiobacillus sp. TaxID=924 RepID=UPI0025E5E240|nr:hypothetical protein [Thiobacillus sp.]MBT9540267.1 hypothetical protein [Thiobacillus sp.]